MKKIASFLLGIGTFCIVNAQNEFDTAIQNRQDNSTTSKLFTKTLVISANTNEVKMMPVKKGLTMMPGAGSKNIKLLYNASEAGNVVLVVLDDTGKKVLSQDASITAGKNYILLNNFFTLNEGSYSIQLIGKAATYTTTFIIWK